MAQSGKKVVAALVLMGVIAFCVYVTSAYIGELFPSERASAWRWFFTAWVVSAIAIALLALPSWINGTFVGSRTPTKEETRSYVRVYSMLGGAVGIVGAWTGFLALPVRLAIGAIGCGALTTLMAYLIALNVTKRGRAMVNRAAKRPDHAA